METKPWYESKTIWGVLMAAAGIFIPRYAPIIPKVVADVFTIASLVGAIYGRFKANKQITK